MFGLICTGGTIGKSSFFALYNSFYYRFLAVILHLPIVTMIVVWQSSIAAAVLVVGWFAWTTSGCGGNRLQIEYIRDCDRENVVKLSENFTVVMRDNCDVHINGCFTSRSDITTAQIDYTVQKDALKRSGKKDGCKQLENKSADVEAAVEKLGLPKRCPVNKGTICFKNKSINVSKYKVPMSMLAGNVKGKALITTDAGKSCMEFSARLINGLQVRTAGLGVIG